MAFERAGEPYNYCYDTLDPWAEAAPDKTCLLSVSDEVDAVDRQSFREMVDASNRMAGLFIAAGVPQGARVLLLLPRLPEWYHVVLGCIRLAIIPIPTTTMSTAADIAYRMARAGATAVICLPQDAEKVQTAVASDDGLSATVRHRWIIQDKYEEAMQLPEHLHGSWQDVDDMKLPKELEGLTRETARQRGYADSKIEDPMILYFTSGTTGKPKMVRHNHGYALSFVATAKTVMEGSDRDVQWSMSDTGWAKTSYGKLYGQWALGTAVVQYRQKGRFCAERALRLVEKTSVTILCVPPTVYRMFVQADLSQYDLSSLERCYSAGEPLNPEVIRVWKQHTGLGVHEFYGQTETGIVVANLPGSELRYGSMGKPVPGIRVEIIDEEGNVLGDEEGGHIAVRAEPERPLGLFMDYWQDDELTASAFSHGWYYSQDKGYRDADGYIWYIGRADDVFKSSGYRIGPFEVESALIEHKDVVEAAVVGVPDPEGTRGLLIKAFVILRPGVEGSDALRRELQQHVKTATAPYKYPRLLDFVTSLPKTVSGKIRRAELRRRELEQAKAAQGES